MLSLNLNSRRLCQSGWIISIGSLSIHFDRISSVWTVDGGCLHFSVLTLDLVPVHMHHIPLRCTVSIFLVAVKEEGTSSKGSHLKKKNKFNHHSTFFFLLFLRLQQLQWQYQLLHHHWVHLIESCSCLGWCHSIHCCCCCYCCCCCRVRWRDRSWCIECWTCWRYQTWANWDSGFRWCLFQTR